MARFLSRGLALEESKGLIEEALGEVPSAESTASEA